MTSFEEFLAEKGYQIAGTLNREGKTADVIPIRFEGENGLKSERIAKLTNFGSVSLRAKLYEPTLRKIHEAASTNEITHPFLDPVIDAFTFKEMPVTIKLKRGLNLEQVIEEDSKWKLPQIIQNLQGPHEAIVHMLRSGFVHRDIKPQNLVENPGGFVITDSHFLQKQSDITDVVPIFGSSWYAHPRLLNGFMKGENISADIQSEMYSWGATVFYAATGEHLCDYEIQEHPLGKELPFLDTDTKVALFANGTLAEYIDFFQHNAIVKEKTQHLPKTLRDFVRYCTQIDQHESKNLDEMNEQFSEMIGQARNIRNKEITYQVIRKAAWTVLPLAVLGGLAIMEGFRDPAPPINQLLTTQQIIDYKTVTDTSESVHFWESDKRINLSQEEISMVQNRARDYGLEEKLLASIILAGKISSGSTRNVYQVPEEYLNEAFISLHAPTTKRPINAQLGFACDYISLQHHGARTGDDIIVNYFTTRAQEAIVRNDKSILDQTSEKYFGVNVSNARALFHLFDDNLEIDWSNIPVINNPYSQE